MAPVLGAGLTGYFWGVLLEMHPSASISSDLKYPKKASESLQNWLSKEKDSAQRTIWRHSAPVRAQKHQRQSSARGFWSDMELSPLFLQCGAHMRGPILHHQPRPKQFLPTSKAGTPWEAEAPQGWGVPGGKRGLSEVLASSRAPSWGEFGCARAGGAQRGQQEQRDSGGLRQVQPCVGREG